MAEAREREQDYLECAQRTGLLQESWFVVSLPSGARRLCAYLEAEDRGVAATGTSDEFDLWFRDRLGDVTGRPWSAEDELGRAELLLYCDVGAEER
jgi:hypothetical protein